MLDVALLGGQVDEGEGRGAGRGRGRRRGRGRGRGWGQGQVDEGEGGGAGSHASSSSKRCSLTSAETVAPTPPLRVDSSRIASLCVLISDAAREGH